MKKLIIGALVGGIILFIWSFMSWGLLNLHGAEQKYTPKQDSILAYLGNQFSEDGAYFMPTYPPGTSRDDMEKQMQASVGQPWAKVVYHKKMDGMNKMFMNMARGLLVDFVMICILCWLLLKIPNARFSTIFMANLAVGLLIFLGGPYMMHIWFGSFDLMAHLADVFISFGATGLWLGWWLRRGST
ncbi:MAG: hypothetical protein ABIO79_04200 [Ferruginibacter sp.]